MADEQTETAAEEMAPGRPLGAGIVLFLGVVWLVVTLVSAHSNLATRGDGAAVASAAALSLPSIVIGAMIAGAAAGLYAAALLARRRGSLGRLVVGAVTGLLVGLIVGGIIVIAYGSGSSIVTLAGTVAVAAVVGGLAAALPGSVLTAGLVASYGVLVLTVAISQFQSPLKSLLGADATAESMYNTAYTLAYLTDAVAAVVAGVLAYVFLRRQRTTLAWPWFALAGGLTGLLLLFAFVVTLVGGAPLFDQVRRLSPLDATLVDAAEEARLTFSLIVFFVGTIVAMLLVGRTIKRPEPESGE